MRFMVQWHLTNAYKTSYFVIPPNNLQKIQHSFLGQLISPSGAVEQIPFAEGNFISVQLQFTTCARARQEYIQP